MASAIALARGPNLLTGVMPLDSSDPRFVKLLEQFPVGSARAAFLSGWNRPLPGVPAVKANPNDTAVDPQAFRSGQILGIACRLQSVRAGGPIKLLSPLAAWELGE